MDALYIYVVYACVCGCIRVYVCVCVCMRVYDIYIRKIKMVVVVGYVRLVPRSGKIVTGYLCIL